MRTRDLKGEVALRGAGVAKLRCFDQGNFAPMARFAPWLIPVIAFRNSFKRAGSAYSAAKSGWPPVFASF